MLFDESELTSVSDVYGASTGKLDPSARPYVGKPGRQAKAKFGVNSYPDDGAKQILKLAIYRYHIAAPNAVAYAYIKTHETFGIYPGQELSKWFANQAIQYARQTLKAVNCLPPQIKTGSETAYYYGEITTPAAFGFASYSKQLDDQSDLDCGI